MKRVIKNVKVGRTKISYFEMGSGRPIISLVAGIHGDETNSQLVIDRLIGKINRLKKGTLRVIPSANEPAVEECSRETPDDDKNLNRVFPGGGGNSLTYKIARHLFNIVKDSDLVIDIHNYYTKIPLVDVYFKIGKDIDEENKALFAFLGPQVWTVDIKEEKEYSGSLGGALSKIGVRNLTIEIPKPEFSDKKDIENCADKILNLLRHLKVIEGKAKKYPVRYYDREACVASAEGIFIPKTKLFSKVKKGQVVGIVKDMITGKENSLRAPMTGKLLEILNKSFVYSGREVCAIGRLLK